MEKFGRLVSLLILPLIAVIVYSASKGYFFGRTPIWTFEMSMFIFGCFFMLGAGYCHMEKKHIAVDVVNHYLPLKWQKIFGIFSEAVVIFLMVAIIYVSVPAALRSFAIRERSTHQTPFNPAIWWFRWVIPVACTLITWQAVRNMISLLSIKSDPAAGPEKG